LAINVSPTTASQLQVTGASSLAGTVAFSYAAGTYSTGIYPILTSASGVSGQFGSITETGAVPQTLLRSVLYKPGEVDLALSQPSVAQAQGSGVFTDATGTAQHNTLAVTAFLLDRDTARCTADTQNICVWADATGHYATFDGHASASGFNSNTGSFLIGAHQRIADNVLLGIGAGYDHSDIDAGIAHAGFGTARVFLYGDIDLAPAVLSGAIGYAHDWFSSHRNGSADYLTAIGTASQSHDASEYSAGLQLGLPTLVDTFQVDPKFGLQYADIDEAGFHEQGADPLDLAGDSYTHGSLRSFIRLDVSRQVNVDDIILTPRLSAGYARELLSPGSTVALMVNSDVAHPDNPFLSRDIVTAGTGIDLSARENLHVSIDYDANFYTGNGLDQILRLEARLAL
jgi:outer membrane autotransporter protein